MLTIPKEMVPLQIARGAFARCAIPDIDGITINAGEYGHPEFGG